MGIGDLIGVSSESFSQVFVAFYVIIPIIVYAAMGIAAIFFTLWFIKFKYVVYVHSQRADGKIIIKKTRGGFFTNRITKVERLRILSDLKAFIPPPPNRFIILEGRKNIIHLLRTTGREYIPIQSIKDERYLGIEKAIRCKDCNVDYVVEDEKLKELKECPECKSGNIEKGTILVEKTDFQVHPEMVKDWFEIASNEDERKYRVGSWIMENQTLIIALTWGVVFLMSVMFIMGQVENAIKMGAAVAASCREQIAESIGLIPLTLLRRFKK